MTLLAFKRKIYNYFFLSISTFLALFSLFLVAWLLITLLKMGYRSFTFATITHVTQPPDANGGLLNPTIGTLLISFSALLLGSPIGILVGLYTAEYHPRGPIPITLRFFLQILLGVPSILIGLYVYQIYVLRVGHFSGWAGCFALSIMVFPIVALTTENVYTLVPMSVKESVLALGAPRLILIRFMIITVLKTEILTGILLALSRIIGEAAPLLFTALNNSFWSIDMNKPMANLPSTIFNYAMSPYTEWQQLAWTGLLIITAWVLIINLLCRFLITQVKTSR